MYILGCAFWLLHQVVPREKAGFDACQFHARISFVVQCLNMFMLCSRFHLLAHFEGTATQCIESFGR